MSGSRKTVSKYLAAFLAAAALHIGFAVVLGDFVNHGAGGVPQTERMEQQDTLVVSFYQPPPARLQPEVTESITRLHDPLPAPHPEPAPEEPAVENPTPLIAREKAQASESPVPPQAVETAFQSPGAPVEPQVNRRITPHVKTEKPRPLQPIDAQAAYPLGARLRGEEGAVHILVFIDVEGRVDELKISQSSGFAALDRAAERAVRRTRFEPATRSSQPVAGELTITIRFSLES